jgi:hypothetical protein
MSYVVVFGREADGTSWTNLYKVGGRSMLEDLDQVILHEGVDIWSIDFYGRTPTSVVPDVGSTFILFSLALCALAMPRKWA